MQYDGTEYLSTDNGASYQTFPMDQAASHELDPSVPMQFLGMVNSVTDAGDVEINGVEATEYNATLDPVKLTNFLRASLAAGNDPLAVKIANNTGGTDGTLEAYIDGDGQVLSDEGSWTDAIDLGAFDPADAGDTMNVQVSFQGAFSDFGTPLTITRPLRVTGATSLV